MHSWRPFNSSDAQGECPFDRVAFITLAHPVCSRRARIYYSRFPASTERNDETGADSVQAAPTPASEVPTHVLHCAAKVCHASCCLAASGGRFTLLCVSSPKVSFRLEATLAERHGRGEGQ